MEYLLLFVLVVCSWNIAIPEQMNYWWHLQMVVVVSEVLWVDLNERRVSFLLRTLVVKYVFALRCTYICTTQMLFCFLNIFMFSTNKDMFFCRKFIMWWMLACIIPLASIPLNVLYLLSWHQDKGTGSINLSFLVTGTDLQVSSLQTVHK